MYTDKVYVSPLTSSATSPPPSPTNTTSSLLSPTTTTTSTTSVSVSMVYTGPDTKTQHQQQRAVKCPNCCHVFHIALGGNGKHLTLRN